MSLRDFKVENVSGSINENGVQYNNICFFESFKLYLKLFKNIDVKISEILEQARFYDCGDMLDINSHHNCINQLCKKYNIVFNIYIANEDHVNLPAQRFGTSYPENEPHLNPPEIVNLMNYNNIHFNLITHINEKINQNVRLPNQDRSIIFVDLSKNNNNNYNNNISEKDCIIESIFTAIDEINNLNNALKKENDNCNNIINYINDNVFNLTQKINDTNKEKIEITEEIYVIESDIKKNNNDIKKITDLINNNDNYNFDYDTYFKNIDNLNNSNFYGNSIINQLNIQLNILNQNIAGFNNELFLVNKLIEKNKNLIINNENEIIKNNKLIKKYEDDIANNNDLNNNFNNNYDYKIANYNDFNNNYDYVKYLNI